MTFKFSGALHTMEMIWGRGWGGGGGEEGGGRGGEEAGFEKLAMHLILLK